MAANTPTSLSTRGYQRTAVPAMSEHPRRPGTAEPSRRDMRGMDWAGAALSVNLALNRPRADSDDAKAACSNVAMETVCLSASLWASDACCSN